MQDESAATLSGCFGTVRYVSLRETVGPALDRMPWCHRVLLENILRCASAQSRDAATQSLLAWLETGCSDAEITFTPLRILMHDTTCGPALVDIAAMRDALAQHGGDPTTLNPAVPVATSVDHSVAVDISGVPSALHQNMAREFERNAERYRFMKWAAGAIDGFRVFPPGSGIMHTINLERLATVVTTVDHEGAAWAVPDTLIGTDSHTPMVNGIGVLAWGVGGIEAEGAMFGVPLTLRIPDVIGVRLAGALRPGAMATDLALVVTERLRREGVAGEFVEFFGAGLGTLSAGQRAVVSNMSPEYGASTGCFPIDARTLSYLRTTGRRPDQLELIEAYARAQGLWHTPDQQPVYTRIVEIDLSAIGPSLAGPHRPQDRFDPAAAPARLRGLFPDTRAAADDVPADAIAIAAITSCTNTTDTGLLVAAGIVARNARRLGLTTPRWVKTSLTPGSPAAGRRLARAGLLDDLEALGFGIAGIGCATCIGNSGPLLPVMNEAIGRRGLKPLAVLSGNRNFPGRVHAQIDSALLASPPLVVAYALAGRALLDITRDPIATAPDGRPILLTDLWPGPEEIDAVVEAASHASDIEAAYSEAEASQTWRELDAPDGARFPWDSASTYLRPPPFVTFSSAQRSSSGLVAHPLLVLGDDVTTDHISPAGAIPRTSDAGQWLVKHGEDPRDLNVYAARRGNWEVMLRGLFTNRTLKNRLIPEAEPGHTVFAPTGDVLPVWRAAARYAENGMPTVIVAGERYGTGSSRDWAAKGLALLGVQVVLANSFERIHRSNLIGMGILPLRLPAGWRPAELGIAPGDTLELAGDLGALAPDIEIPVTLRRAGSTRHLTGSAVALLQTQQDVALIRAGGMVPLILQRAVA